MSSPLVSTWSSGDGLSLTTTRVDVRLIGKDQPTHSSPAERKALHPLPLDGRFTCLEDVHVHLKASGGRFLGTPEQEREAHEQHPSEIWVWDTTLFMKIFYHGTDRHPPFAFKVYGAMLAFVNEGWHAQALIEHKRVRVNDMTHNEKGHQIVCYTTDLDTFEDLLASVAWIRRFSDPVVVEDLLRLEHPPFLNFMKGYSQLSVENDKKTLDAYFGTLLPRKAIVTHWETLHHMPERDARVTEEIHRHCARDDIVRQHLLKLPDNVLQDSRRLYEQWSLWINGKRRTLPPCGLDPSLGPMVALPSLLMVTSDDRQVQAQREQLLSQVLDQMTPEAMRYWWCTPDALGKTGAQWFFFGLLGNGTLSTETYEERVQWGKAILQKIEHLIGPQDDAWISEYWTPAGLCVEVIGATTMKSARAVVPHLLQCLALLPEKALLHPARCLTLQPFFQESVETGTQNFYNRTLDVPFVHCVLSFAFDTPHEPLMDLIMSSASGPGVAYAWDTLLTNLSLCDPDEEHACDGPFPHFRNTFEHRMVLKQFLEQGARLQLRASLTQTLESLPQAPGHAAGAPRRRV